MTALRIRSIIASTTFLLLASVQVPSNAAIPSRRWGRRDRFGGRDSFIADHGANRNLESVLRLPLYYVDSILSVLQNLRGGPQLGYHGGGLLAGDRKSSSFVVQPPVGLQPTTPDVVEKKPPHGSKSSPSSNGSKPPTISSHGSGWETSSVATPAATKKEVHTPDPPLAAADKKKPGSGTSRKKKCGDDGNPSAPKEPSKSDSLEISPPKAEKEDGSGFLPKNQAGLGGDCSKIASKGGSSLPPNVAPTPSTVSDEVVDVTTLPTNDKHGHKAAQPQAEESKPEPPKQKQQEPPAKPQRPGHSELRVFLGVSPLTLLNKICHGQRNSCAVEFGDSLHHAIREATQDSTFARDRLKIGGVSARSGGVEQTVVISNDGDLQVAQAVKQVLQDVSKCTNANSPSRFPICQTATGKQLSRHNVKAEVTSIRHIR